VVQEKNQIAIDLQKEKLKMKNLLENVSELEKMVSELSNRAPSPIKSAPSKSSVKVYLILM
jgi:hypothetical protein